MRDVSECWVYPPTRRISGYDERRLDSAREGAMKSCNARHSRPPELDERMN